MPIDPNFPKNHKITGRVSDILDKNFYYIWGPGENKEASQNEDVINAYKDHDESITPIGVHGTIVAVDWDSCVAQGNCLDVCPTDVFQWYRTEKNIPATDVPKRTFSGRGMIERTGRLDRTDKAQPIREMDCSFCMQCVQVCPTVAIKVDQSNMSVHKNSKFP
ncbi:ferredoxin family protein [Nitrosopumilus sp. Nsub]|uniref:4Fe-4S dicluster domain-containing protein n=1 Tax=Nitrosopumilus sp. Nsub TaxID=1776294 RepID=UPI00083225FB|nr:ferredoxin family protein [Nitrosopumilus sp. Nsub]